MVLIPVTLSDPNYPNHPIFDISYRLSYLRSGSLLPPGLSLLHPGLPPQTLPWTVLSELFGFVLFFLIFSRF